MSSCARPDALQFLFQARDQLRQIAFALRQRETAGRQCHAGQRIAPQSADVRIQAVRLAAAPRPRPCAPAGMSASTRFWFGVMMKRPTPSSAIACRPRSRSLHAAVLDEQREVPGAVIAFRPAEPIAVVGEREVACRRQRIAQPPFQLRAERGEAHALDGVFQPRVLAVGAVAEVALHRHDLLGDIRPPAPAGRSRSRRRCAGTCRARRASCPCRRRPRRCSRRCGRPARWR